MHINGIKTSLPRFLLLVQFIIIQRYPFGLALLSYMCPNKGMVKGWLKGTHVHHNMNLTCMLKKGMLKRGTKEHMHTQHEGMHLHPRDTTISYFEFFH